MIKIQLVFCRFFVCSVFLLKRKQVEKENRIRVADGYNVVIKFDLGPVLIVTNDEH